jgi:hypothetical protein
MSEFSDSYHVLAHDTRDVARLIRRSGRYGMILPALGRYIPFVVEGLDEVGGPMDAIVDHNEGILIHYSFSDEDGCWTRVFEGATELADLPFVTALAGQADLRANLHEQPRARGLAVLLDRGIIDPDIAARLEAAAQQTDPREVGPQVATALGLEHVAWLSCADLTYQSERALREVHPGAQFVNVAQRGKAPAGRTFEQLMALPVPQVSLDAGQQHMAQRHYRYWTEFGDFDNESSEGYWMYELYKSALPTRYRYLPDRLMNLRDGGPDTLARIQAIIGLAGPGVDWELYLRGY